MKTKAAERRPSSTNSNLVLQRSDSQPFFQKHADAESHSTLEPAFFPASVQAKLTIGKPNDKYEKEADAMADKVVNGNGQAGTLTAPTAAPTLQNKCAGCENEGDKMQEEKVQAKALHPQISTLIQRQAEGEEEEVQAQMEQEEEPVQRQAEEEEEEVQAKMEEEETLQRQVEEEEEEVQAKTEKEEEEPVQRRSSKPIIASPANDFSSRLQSKLGFGKPLPEAVREGMEDGFGADFSQVRVHTDESAVALSAEIRAQAFTRGKDIFFNRGKFDPSSSSGKHLLAHELTHTIQQGAVGPKIEQPQIENSPEPDQASSSSDQAVAPEANSPEPLPLDQNGPLSPDSAPPPPAAAPGEEGEAKAETIEKAPNSAEEDPQFQEQLQVVEKKGKKQRQHQPGSVETANTKRAAKAPANEVEAFGKGKHVGALEEEGQKAPPFSAETFKAELKKRIEAIAPKSLGAMENFKKDGGVDKVKNTVNQDVKKERDNTVGPLEKKNEEKPDETGIEKKDYAPMPDRPKPPARGALDETAATPKPKTADEWERPAQQQIATFDEDDLKNDVDDTQLEEGNEPDFDKYLRDKQQAKTTIAENIQTYRTEEQSTLEVQKADTGEAGKRGLGGFALTRKSDLEKIDKQQGDTISKDELARQKVATDLENIFNATKTKVESTLSTMETDVNTYFDEQAKIAQDNFIDFVESELDAYKDRRYSGLRGKARKLRDWWKGLPGEANKFYVAGKDQYIRDMDLVIDHVANLVVKGLNDAQTEITKGRENVQTYLATLKGDLEKFGSEVAEGIESKFDSLESTIHSKQEQMIGDLAKKYTDNLQQVNDQIEKWKVANKGMAAKIKDFALGIWNTIKSLAKMLWSIVERIGNVVGKIIKAPVRFFKNLVSGVKQGFDQFKKNLEKHLKAALFNWLFGTMGKAGIQLPKNFDLKGIFSLILQVLGLGMAAIKARAVKILGEPIVQKLEKVGEIFKILMTDGPGALIQHAMDKVSELKEKVVDEIKEMVSTEIITAGITFVLGMLTPVGAFIKACKGIYNLIKFFIQRAKDIAALISAILDSVEAMIAGNIQKAADKIEDSLARFLPLGIGFLASLVGISGMADKVRKIVDRVRTKIQEKIIDPVIKKAYSFAQKAGKFIGDSKLGKMAKSGTAFVKKKAVQAKEKVQAGVAKVKGKIVSWWTTRKKFKAADGAAHTLYFDGKPENAKLMVRSTPQTYKDFIKTIPASTEDKATLETLADQIDAKIATYKSLPQDERVTWGSELVELMNRVGALTEKYAFGEEVQPPTVITWDPPNAEGFGTGFNAKLLSENYVSGELAKEENKAVYGWDIARSRKTFAQKSGNITSVYVKGHLLNDNLGGKANVTNLTPITIQANNKHKEEVESKVKKIILGKSSSKDKNPTAKSAANYEVQVMYDKHPDRNSLKNQFYKRVSMIDGELATVRRNDDDNKDARISTLQTQRNDLIELVLLLTYEEHEIPTSLMCTWRKMTYDPNQKKWVPDPNDGDHFENVENNLPNDIPAYNFVVRQFVPEGL